jgi:hypothetical protein
VLCWPVVVGRKAGDSTGCVTSSGGGKTGQP